MTTFSKDIIDLSSSSFKSQRPSVASLAQRSSLTSDSIFGEYCSILQPEFKAIIILRNKNFETVYQPNTAYNKDEMIRTIGLFSDLCKCFNK